MGLFVHFKGQVISTTGKISENSLSSEAFFPQEARLNQAKPRATWSSLQVTPALRRTLGYTSPEVPFKWHPSPFCEPLLVLKGELNTFSAKANGGLLANTGSTKRWVWDLLWEATRRWTTLPQLSIWTVLPNFVHTWLPVLNLTPTGMFKISPHPDRQLEIWEVLCCSSTGQQLCSAAHSICRLTSCHWYCPPTRQQQISADRGRALTCRTTFVSWGTMVMIREPRSTLRRVSLLGAALLRPAWRAEDSIFISTHGTPQHSAPARLSYMALQGSPIWTNSVNDNRPVTFKTGRGSLSAKHFCTPSREMSSVQQEHKAQQSRWDEHRQLQRTNRLTSCLSQVLTPLIARCHQELFLLGSCLCHTPSNSTQPFLFFWWRVEEENTGLSCWKQWRDISCPLRGACDIQSQFPVLLALW